MKLHPEGKDITEAEATYLPGLEVEHEERVEDGEDGGRRTSPKLWPAGWARKADAPVDAVTLPLISEELLSVVTKHDGLDTLVQEDPLLKEADAEGAEDRGGLDEGAPAWVMGAWGVAPGRAGLDAEEEEQEWVARRTNISRSLGAHAGV
jgi:hypothetical protein